MCHNQRIILQLVWTLPFVAQPPLTYWTVRNLYSTLPPSLHLGESISYQSWGSLLLSDNPVSEDLCPFSFRTPCLHQHLIPVPKTGRPCEGCEILPSLQVNKLAYFCFTAAGRRLLQCSKQHEHAHVFYAPQVPWKECRWAFLDAEDGCSGFVTQLRNSELWNLLFLSCGQQMEGDATSSVKVTHWKHNLRKGSSKEQLWFVSLAYSARKHKNIQGP